MAINALSWWVASLSELSSNECPLMMAGFDGNWHKWFIFLSGVSPLPGVKFLLLMESFSWIEMSHQYPFWWLRTFFDWDLYTRHDQGYLAPCKNEIIAIEVISIKGSLSSPGLGFCYSGSSFLLEFSSFRVSFLIQALRRLDFFLYFLFFFFYPLIWLGF